MRNPNHVLTDFMSDMVVKAACVPDALQSLSVSLPLVCAPCGNTLGVPTLNQATWPPNRGPESGNLCAGLRSLHGEGRRIDGEKEEGDTAADVGPLCVLSRIPCGLCAARAPKIISGVPVSQRPVHELLYNAVPLRSGTCSFILLKNKHQSTAPPVKNCACSEVLRNLV